MKFSRKILLVTDNLGSGGAQNQMTLLAVSLAKKGYEVLVFTYYEQDFFKSRLEEANVEVVHVPKKYKIGVNVILSLAKLIGRRKIGRIIAFQDTPNFYAVCAAKLSWLHPTTIVSYRSKTDFSNLSWWVLKSKEWVNQYATYIVSNSKHEKERWSKKYPGLQSKFRVIYNGVGSKAISSEKRLVNHLIVVGKVRPLKNAHLLVEAVHILKNKYGREVCIHWYGSKEFTDAIFQKYVGKAEQKIKSYGLEEQFSWYQPTNQLKNIYNTYEALIHPSLLEGLPNAICEALYSGLPVLASRILDHPILVKEGVRGYLFDPKDAHEMADVIKRFLDLKESKKEKMRLACLEYAEKELSMKKMCNSYESLLE